MPCNWIPVQGRFSRPGLELRRKVFRKMPIHFGTDVWSPPQGWDHDYDWKAPPNQRCEGGATAFRYHRWGPMQRYRDVTTSITYTFYAHVPYVHVSSTMDFTEDRSARMVRMGEIVVDHSAKPGSAQNEGETPPADVFSHYAWPDAAGAVVERDVMASLDEEGWAALDGLARGALAILERDVPWVAAYDAERGYGMATLRRAQFAGNRLGGPIPHSAPCTYLSNYGWGFTYWSRPMVAPLGQRQTPLDRNTAIAAGTLFATEEALLVFEPGNDGGPAQERLKEVTEAQARFVRPLRFVYKGTGPW